MLIDRAGIARLIPHAGAMCLLDGVLSWGEARIECVSSTHHWAENPLRHDGGIGILCGVEYAAQAMALHAALDHFHPDRAGCKWSSPLFDRMIHTLGRSAQRDHALGDGGTERPRRGYLASLRAVSCHADRLDAVPGRLLVEAERLLGEAGRVIYGFAVRHEAGVLLSGRAAVVLEQGEA